MDQAQKLSKSPALGEGSAEQEEAVDGTVDIRTQSPADTVSELARMKLSLDDIRDHIESALRESQHQIDVLNQVLAEFSEAIRTWTAVSTRQPRFPKYSSKVNTYERYFG